ncbi:MAG: GNAT family N-acetyltransferase [Methanobrevibacter sp.]|nr:GNAT family N-acetyltransferase [Methanobrevibacter sp.]
MIFEVGNRKDLNGIVELNKQLDENNNSLKTFNLDIRNKIWDKIENNNIKYFLAKDNGNIIGSCYICIIPNLSRNGKSIGFIENVIIDNNYRRKGIGKKLMEMAINYGKENNCYKIVLQSGIKRTEAHKFYENIGFNGKSKKAFDLRL